MKRKWIVSLVLSLAAVALSGMAYAVPALGQIELGLILASPNESHCFMFGGLGLSGDKSAETEFLVGVAHDLAFSDEFTPPWPEWPGVRISAVYAHAGPEVSTKFLESMTDPSGVAHCQTLGELFRNCNCVFLVSTADNGAVKDELVPQCLAAGKPLFVDKFLGSSLQKAREFISLAEEQDVRLASASLLWMGQPALDLKAQLAGRQPTRVASTGWSGGGISGDIHPIAHLLSIAGDARPVSVRYESGDAPMAVVTFDNGLTGELVGRRPAAIFELDAECDGEILNEGYDAKHSRPSAINMLQYFFDYVRGKNDGVPARVMEDYLAISDATAKAQATAAMVVLDNGPRQLGVADLELRRPVPAAPFYHFAARLELPEPGPVYVHEIKVNGVSERNFFLVGRDDIYEPERPRERRRLAIAGALMSPRPDWQYEEPMIIGRADWQNGETCTVEITLGVGGKKADVYWATAEAVAPDTGGYWDAAWSHYQSAVITEPAGLDRVDEPVQVCMLAYPDTVSDLARVIRVVQYDWRAGTHIEIPSQVLDTANVPNAEAPMYDEHGAKKPATYLPTRSATIAFPATVGAKDSGVYLIFYGNPDAPAPAYEAGLAVRGTSPGLAIENDTYRLKLHDLSGMLDEVTLKAKPEYTFVHKKETNGAIQWNPGCYAPPRAWVHVSDWKPGEHDYAYEEVRGPVVFRTRRWGQMPMMPEITVSMEYEFYAGAPYFVMRSSMHLRHEVAAQALRNAEVVFAREAFSEAAWWDAAGQCVVTQAITSAPDLTEWTMPDTTPWVAFFDRDKGCGYGGIQMDYMNGGLDGRLRTLNPYMYVTTGPWIYWTRALAYPYGSRNPQQLIKVPAGSVFLEEWAYLPFELGDDEKDLFGDVEDLQARLTNPLLVHLEEPIDPRMEIPEEIYIEPTKTGWEEGESGEE